MLVNYASDDKITSNKSIANYKSYVLYHGIQGNTNDNTYIKKEISEAIAAARITSHGKYDSIMHMGISSSFYKMPYNTLGLVTHWYFGKPGNRWLRYWLDCSNFGAKAFTWTSADLMSIRPYKETSMRFEYDFHISYPSTRHLKMSSTNHRSFCFCSSINVFS